MSVVADVMTREVASCQPENSLSHAARLMWERGCGSVPVTDAGSQLLGIITDRDVAMGGLLRGAPLHDLDVGRSMQAEVHVCRDTDTLDVPQRIMRQHRVRRVPVVDGERRLVGLVSMTDLMRAVSGESTQARRRRQAEELVHTATAVSRPHDAPVPEWMPEVEAAPVKATRKRAPAKAAKTKAKGGKGGKSGKAKAGKAEASAAGQGETPKAAKGKASGALGRGLGDGPRKAR